MHVAYMYAEFELKFLCCLGAHTGDTVYKLHGYAFTSLVGNCLRPRECFFHYIYSQQNVFYTCSM